MKILIVYDSVFNNTEKIAFGIKEILSHKHEVNVIKAADSEASDFLKLDYLFIGSPTRAFRPTGMVTKFIKNLDKTLLSKLKIAIFDTRLKIDESTPKILRLLEKKFGYANDSMESLIEKNTGNKVEKTYFYVDDTEGPLMSGELKRAKTWAENIIKNV